MKILMTPDSIISLENVRRVEKRIIETKHTSYGKPYIVTNYEILISYMGGQDAELIRFGDGNSAKVLCETAFHDIYAKLSEG